MATTDSEKDEEMKAREAEERAEEDDAEGSDEEGAREEETSSDAEGSDEEETSSDDDGAEGSDESDDESSDDETADESASAASEPARTKTAKGPRRHKDGMTAGARLAAAKAAKAARKAAKRGKEKKAADPIAQMRESALAHKVEKAGSWAKDNHTVVWAAVAVLVVVLGGWVGWHFYSGQQAQAAAALLEDAVEIADAQIVAEEDEGDEHEDTSANESASHDDDEPPTFPTQQARAEAAVEAYRRVLTQYPSSAAASWARLGEARALFELGRYGDARESYDRAVHEGGAETAVVLRALEGKAFTFEAEEHWDQALEVYQELARVDDGRFDPIAKYHTARMYLAKGDRDRATETLRGLVDSLREAEDDEDAQDFQYVLAQAQTRLRELDPSAVPAPATNDSPFGGLGALGGGGGDNGGQLTDEQIQELIRRFQQQQQQGGGAGGGAE